MKKILLSVAVFVTTAILCIISAGAETYGDYEYTVLDDGTVEINCYYNIEKDVTIPSEINGKPVTVIGNNSFAGCRMLETVTIPNTVTKIDFLAFSNCSQLTTIKLPDNLTSIEEYAFSGCDELISIDIPDSVTYIGNRAFYTCSSLKSVKLPKGLTCIGSNLFNSCKSLTSIDIPDTVTGIGDGAFYGCHSLQSVNIPDGVTAICDSAFGWCTSLKSVTIPDSITSIGKYAFVDCSALSSITLSKNLKAIEEYAFNSTAITTLNIPDETSHIGKGAFSFCEALETVTLPQNLTTISENLFLGCSALKSISIPENVTKIDKLAFIYCNSLATIILPESLETIGEASFCDCAITSINIPKNVTNIYDEAFEHCLNLTAINVDSANSNYCSENGILYNKNKNAILSYPAGKTSPDFTIPENVTTIGNWAFVYCEKLATVKLHNNITSIGKGAFYGCVSISDIDIPESVTSIGDRAFIDCGILAVTIPRNVSSLGEMCFGYKADYDIGEYVLNDNFLMICNDNSPAKNYAISNGIKYRLIDKVDNIENFKLGGRASNALRLNWTKNTSADGYIIEQYKSGKWVRVAKITNPATTTYRVTGLKAGTAYKFRMKAYRMDGSKALYSAYTSTLSARTNPSNVAGFKLGGRAADALRLNWTKNTSADGYIIEQYKSGKWVRIAKITSNATTTYKISGLKASTQYKFRVRAYKMSGKTALYSGYTGTLSAYTTPSKVANLKITGKATTALRLGWSKNTSADGYIIEMYKDGKWVRAAKITSNATVTFRKAGLKKGTTYKFRVKAYNMVGKTALYGNYVNVSGTTNK